MSDILRKLRDELSAMKAPHISELEPRTVLVRLTPPDLPSLSLLQHSNHLNISTTDLSYTLEISDKGKEPNAYKQVYSGDATEITLKDLKPGNVYSLRVFAALLSHSKCRGDYAPASQFQTRATQPDEPSPPKEVSKKKNEISLKWSSVNDNGSKILNFILEYDEVSLF